MPKRVDGRLIFAVLTPPVEVTKEATKHATVSPFRCQNLGKLAERFKNPSDILGALAGRDTTGCSAGHCGVNRRLKRAY